MFVYLTVFALVSIGAFLNWKKAVLIWFPLQMCFNECVCLRYTPPAVTLNLAVDSMLLFMYYFKGCKRSDLNQGVYIYNKAFFAIMLSYGFSMIVSIVPFGTVLTGTIKYFIEGFIILFLLHKALNTTDDIKTIFRGYLIVTIMMTVLAIFEAVYKVNPWLDFVWLNSDINAIKGKMYYIPSFLKIKDAGLRFGLTRCYSFFNIHIAYGWASIMMFYLFLFALLKGKIKFLPKNLLIIALIASLTGILLCNSKTPMVGLPFFLLGLVNAKRVFNMKFFSITIIVVICVLNFLPDYLNNFFALFDSNLAEEGGGSTAQMRVRQYEVGWNMFTQSPLLGNGIGSIGYMMSQSDEYADLLGSESIWLKILPQRGIVGLVTYLYGFFTIYRILVRNMSKKTAFMLLAGILAMATATPLGNFYIWGAVIMICNRLAYLNKEQV